MSEKLEHIRRAHLERILAHDYEERLQVVRHGAHGVRSRSAGHELQIRVEQPVTEREAVPATHSHKTRDERHPGMLATPDEMTRDT
jgi:hypothetical protein